MADSVGATAAMSDPRVIKTHLPLELLPPNLLDTAKVIVCARNVKDSIVSWFHHEKMLPVHGLKSDCNFEDFAKMYMKGDVLYGDYWSHFRV